MNVVITGAAGFLGRVLTARLLAAGAGDRYTLIDQHFAAEAGDARVRQLAGALPDVAGAAAALDAADVVYHLAAVPGGAAERDYAASRRVNLDASLALLERLAARPAPARVVYASSIAVYGEPLPAAIDDGTVPRPSMTYGAHKLMVETALADLSRRGRIDGLALRLPGLVARPSGGTGMRSAFMSELFHACVARRPFIVPTGPAATVWVMSAGCAAENLRHAAAIGAPPAGVPRAFTVPALRVTMQQLVAAVVRGTGCDGAAVRFERDAALEGQFGRLPPLATPHADALGFRHDGDLERLVRQALADAGYDAR